MDKTIQKRKYIEDLPLFVDYISLSKARNIALAGHFNKKTQDEYNMCLIA